MGTSTAAWSVSLHPLSLGVSRHPLCPRAPETGPDVPFDEAIATSTALADRTAELLDAAADPSRAPVPGLVRELRRRMAGIAATIVAERDDEIAPDVAWASHDGPLRVMAHTPDGLGPDVLDDDRRLRWSAGLPPVMVVERSHSSLSIRPLVLDARETPPSIIDRMRLAASLGGL